MTFIKNNPWIIVLAVAFISAMSVFTHTLTQARSKAKSEIEQKISLYNSLKCNLIEDELKSTLEELKLLGKRKNLDSFLVLTNQASYVHTDSSQKEMPVFPWAKEVIEHLNFQDLFLINQKGEVVSTYLQENLFATNLLSEKYVTSNLGRAYKSSIESKSATFISNLDYFASDTGDITAFLGVLIFDANGQQIGALIAQLPVDHITSSLDNTAFSPFLLSYIQSGTSVIDIKQHKIDTASFKQKHIAHTTYGHKILDKWQISSSYPKEAIYIQEHWTNAALDGIIVMFLLLIGGILLLVVFVKYTKSKDITNSDIMLVQTSWNRLSEDSAQVIQRFYKHLFESEPEIKKLFKSEPHVQEKRMAAMINTIVNSIDSLDEFRGSISKLAQNHTNMGVKKEYFQILSNALVKSIEEQTGKGFSTSHRKAWQKVLSVVSNIMMEEMDKWKEVQ